MHHFQIEDNAGVLFTIFPFAREKEFKIKETPPNLYPSVKKAMRTVPC